MGTTAISVEPLWTVAVLKEHLERDTGIPSHELRLTSAGRELSTPAANLAESGVGHGDMLYGSLRLVAGGKGSGKGGKRNKRSAKTQDAKRELIFKEDGQEYAQVTALLGSSRLRVMCSDGEERLCTIRGKLVRRAWVHLRDIILVSLRDFEPGKVDMIHKYTDEEARNLRAYKEIPSSMSAEKESEDNEADGLVFGFDGSGDELDEKEINIDGI